MFGLSDFVLTTELCLLVTIITSIVLGSLLLLLKVPDTDYSRKISNAKNTMAVSYYICALVMMVNLNYSGLANFDSFTSLMMFVVTAISSAILSYSLMNVIEENFIDKDKFYLNIVILTVMSCLLMRSFWWEGTWLRPAIFIACIVLFLFHSCIHIILFRRVYRKCVRKVEQYYDEEEDKRLKWVRFCYVIMMLTQVFVLVYMMLPRNFMKIYVIWYAIFMLYFTANYISFIGSHKVMLDAFAYKALSGQDLMRKIDERRKRNARRGRKKGAEVEEVSLPEYTEVEFAKLERALHKWVREKGFREYDKTRDQIADELHTSKEILHLYFTTKMGIDFRSWRTNLRVEEAKRLLLENVDASTSIIAEASGFSDKSNFHRQFVKIVGCSPKEWRESNGK